MRKLFIIFVFFLLFFSNRANSQEFKTDRRHNILKEDPYNMFNSSNITKLDLLKALDYAGINVKKYNIGEFDKKYKFIVMIDEYKNNELVNIDTVFNYNNQYHYYKRGKEKPFFDYIDQIKIFTKQKDSKLKLFFDTYGVSFKGNIEYNKKDEKQFFQIRDYLDTKYKVGEKIPLMIFASSWYDERIDKYRFCGLVKLKSDGKKTKDLLEKSPHYFIINYKVIGTE